MFYLLTVERKIKFFPSHRRLPLTAHLYTLQSWECIGSGSDEPLDKLLNAELRRLGQPFPYPRTSALSLTPVLDQQVDFPAGFTRKKKTFPIKQFRHTGETKKHSAAEHISVTQTSEFVSVRDCLPIRDTLKEHRESSTRTIMRLWSLRRKRCAQSSPHALYCRSLFKKKTDANNVMFIWKLPGILLAFFFSIFVCICGNFAECRKFSSALYCTTLVAKSASTHFECVHLKSCQRDILPTFFRVSFFLPECHHLLSALFCTFWSKSGLHSLRKYSSSQSVRDILPAFLNAVTSSLHYTALVLPKKSHSDFLGSASLLRETKDQFYRGRAKLTECPWSRKVLRRLQQNSWTECGLRRGNGRQKERG